MSILAKYSLWLLGILLLAAGCIAGAALWSQRESLTREAILRGESIALNVSAPAADALLMGNDLLLIGLAVSATQDNKGVVYVALLNDKGEVMGHADQKALMKPLDFAASGELPNLAMRAKVRQGTSGGVGVWDISVPILLKGSTRDLGSAHVGLARSLVEAEIKKSMMELAAVSLAIMVLGVGLTFLSLRVLVRPLRELSKASQKVGKGDLATTVPVRSQDEIGRLAENFNAMVAGLKEAEAAKIVQGRIEGELELARSIQANLLPASPPRVKGLDIAFLCVPAKELGGDFYDCIEVKGGALLGVLIADVSGKGVPAALHMANLRNLFRIFGADSESPSDTIKRVNALVYPDMNAESFVTIIYAVIDPATLKVRMVNAGHDPAFWVHGGRVTSFDGTAPPVGLDDAKGFDPDVSEHSFTMQKGDMLFTFTDGVTEAMNAAGEQFSLQRLKASILGGGSSGEAVARLEAEVRAHAAGAGQSDDITMMAVRAA